MEERNEMSPEEALDYVIRARSIVAQLASQVCQREDKRERRESRACCERGTRAEEERKERRYSPNILLD